MDFELIEKSVRRTHTESGTGANDDAVLLVLYKHVLKGLTELSNEVLKPLGLTQVSFLTLMVLRAAPNNAVNPSFLCEVSGESRANMTRIGDDLVTKGLIQRVPSEADRRRLVISLTPAGMRLIRRLLPSLWQRLTPTFACFDAGEKKLLAKLLKRQLAAINTSLAAET
jgi:MarR family transcriptional regulator, negative regulator of the multidrug operon emrRAB